MMKSTVYACILEICQNSLNKQGILKIISISVFKAYFAMLDREGLLKSVFRFFAFLEQKRLKSRFYAGILEVWQNTQNKLRTLVI